MNLAVDETWAWFLDTKDFPGADAIRRVPKAGGALETVLVSTTHHLTALTVDAQRAYWAEEGLLRSQVK